MKRIPRLIFIITLIFIVLAEYGFCSEASRKFWVNGPRMRYQVLDADLLCYSSDGNKIANRDGEPVFVCPRDLRIIDFDIAEDGGKPVAGILMSRKNFVYLEIIDTVTGAALVVKEMSAYQPWKICFADVDHDSVMEVCLGVYKRSPLHNQPAKRLFIYNYQHGLQPKWLGSRLAHPFTDFGFAGKGKTCILCALEIRSDGQYSINSYAWDSFGFSGAGRIKDVLAGEYSLSRGYVETGGVYRQSLFVVGRAKNYVMEVSVQ